MTLQTNKLGGVVDTSNDALNRAKEADLITLPAYVEGTNCYNCKFIENAHKNTSMCNHSKVNQYVNHRMCCIYWDNPKTYRPYSGSSSKLK